MRTSGTTPFATLAAALDARTVRGRLGRIENGAVRCVACAHRCLIRPGRRGICRVRFNEAGQLRVPSRYVGGLACDPVEKKPFFHVLPGASALTFGMLGCDLHCPYCQNWLTSQTLRDPAAIARVIDISPWEMVAEANHRKARLLVSSYNEPLITAEWAAGVFARARGAGLVCAFVSNGNATEEALDFIGPWLGAMKVDLKSFDDRRYRRLGGTLAAVLRTIGSLHARGIWLEVVTLLVPGFNDDPAELADLTGFLAGVDRRIPWHVTAYHPNYRMTEHPSTTVTDLMRAAEIGVEAGLQFVYVGNRPGEVAHWEDTRCPRCGTPLIQRHGYRVLENRLAPSGTCPDCGERVPGVWSPPRPSGTSACVRAPDGLEG